MLGQKLMLSYNIMSYYNIHVTCWCVTSMYVYNFTSVLAFELQLKVILSNLLL